ncbi:MAG: mismatch repair protein MutS protein, partial [Paenibacillus sp.]|nr:mismatch repair protein MutS protein [Paenibacillus sp.]
NRGRIQVMIQKEKVWLNVKRLSLYIEREKLYPEGEYDMDIVFDSKENRKKRNQMKRKHVEGMTIEYPDPRKSGR